MLPFPKLFLLVIFCVSITKAEASLSLPLPETEEDSLVKVWTKLQKETYYKGEYHNSVMYFDSLLEQRGARINYISFRMGIFCARKAELFRDFSFGEKIFGKQIMAEEWHWLAMHLNARIYESVDVSPTPLGGEKRFNKYLRKKLKYPPTAITNKIEGTVYVRLIINKDGTHGGTCVLKGISLECNQEAERLVRKCVNWTPGYENTKPVYVQVVIPVEFKLPN